VKETAPFRQRGALLTRILLGCLLVAAAGLKLYGMDVSGVPRVGTFATPKVQVLVAGWELVLGLWLLSGQGLVGSWVAAVGTFLTFAGISSYLGAIGQANCQCFGVIKASPWHAFAVDLVALALLGAFRPRFGDVFQTGSPLRPFARGAGALLLGSGVVLLVAGGVAVLVFGSVDAAFARLTGDFLPAEPEHVDFGSGSPGQLLHAHVTLRNRTGQPIRLIGGTSDCTCITTEGLPVIISPGESRSIPIRVVVPKSSGVFTRMVELWTDCDLQRTKRLTVSCQVKPSSEVVSGGRRASP
jgi:hypothetical protein